MIQLKMTSYDAIVSDYQMPEIDGIGFLKWVRESLGDIPFILFTGKGREDVVIEAINNGADFYLQKGGDPKSQFAELGHKIKKAVDQRHAEKALKGSEQRLSDIINFLPDATFAIDPGGKVIAWNLAMEDMTGIPKDAILGKGNYEYALPFYSERRPLLLDLVLRNDEKIKENYPFVQIRDNKIFSQMFIQNLYGGIGAYLWFVASPLYDTNGAITGAIESIRDITEQKKTEEERNTAYEKIAEDEEKIRKNYSELAKRQQELLKSEERYRNVVEDQTEFISRFLPDGTHVFVNEAYCRYFGKSRDDIIGHIFRPEIPKEDLLTLTNHFRSFSPVNPVSMVEHRIIMPNGAEYWQRWSDRAIFDDYGTILEYQSVGRDITDIKSAEIELNRSHEELSAAYEQIAAVEEELRSNYNELARNQNLLQESENRYRNVVEDQTEYISRFLPDGTHVFVNGAYCRCFGKSREEITGRIFRPDIPEEDRNLVRQHFQSLTPDSPVATIAHRIIMPDGSMHWHRWSDRAIFGETGSIVEFQSVGRDITEQKMIEAALRESEGKYRDLVENANSIILKWDKTGKITFFNEFARKFFGYSHEEIIGKPIVGTIVPVTESGSSRDLGLMIEDIILHPGNHILNENENITRDGRRVWIQWQNKPLMDENGQFVGLLSIGTDITERKRAEKALYQANKKLNLLSRITRHDINNQLTVVQGYLTIMERDQNDPTRTEYFRRINTSAQRISSMIRFTKEYEQIGVNAPLRHDCRTLIESAVREAMPGKVLVINNIPVGMDIFADPLIVKVFYNIIDNAVRYGEKITTIRLSFEERDGYRVIVCEDDGVGIPDDEKEKIFDPGFGKNTGMGLFLSREILDITGILIRETGVPGTGARFEITVPDEIGM